MKQRKRSPRIVIAVVCLMAIAGSIAALLRLREPDFDRKAVEMHQRGGVVMAHLVEQALPGGSGRILVVIPDVGALPNPDHRAWFEGMISSFTERLPASITVAAEETIRTSPNRTDPQAPPPLQLTQGGLQQAVKRCGGTDAVVSFAGAPAGRAAKLPPIICFSSSGEHVPELMAEGKVVSAVLPKRTPSPVSGIRREWFDLMYEIVTPDTVARWASP